jgi:hypothetical protein
VDEPNPQFADRTEAERLKVAQAFLGRSDRAIGCSAIERRQPRPDDRRSSRIGHGSETLIRECEGGLDRHTSRRDPSEDLADRFDGLRIDLDR